MSRRLPCSFVSQRSRLRRPHPPAAATDSRWPAAGWSPWCPDGRPRGVRRARAPRSSTWPAAWCCPGSRTPTCTRCRAGVERTPLRPDRAGDAASSTSPRSAAYAEAHPDRPWVLGRRLVDAGLRPGRSARPRDLDAVVPDRPVFLPNRDHHGAWVNTAALRLAGHRPRHPRPGRRPHRARRRRRADRHPARGRDGPGRSGTSRPPRDERVRRRRCRSRRPTCTRSA